MMYVHSYTVIVAAADHTVLPITITGSRMIYEILFCENI